ncbi:MAG: hypothetical protein SFU99_11060 [Saprospiraceae bacterium]|nr:hypothetical protein [Saprospiraceae bacterium]
MKKGIVNIFLLLASIVVVNAQRGFTPDSVALAVIDREFNSFEKDSILSRLDDIRSNISTLFIHKYADGEKDIVFQNRKLVFGLYSKLFITMLDAGLDPYFAKNNPDATMARYSRFGIDTSASVVAREREIKRKIDETNRKIELSGLFERSKKSIKTHFDVGFKKYGDNIKDLEKIIAEQISDELTAKKVNELFRLALKKK